jgi:hypothetical protein
MKKISSILIYLLFIMGFLASTNSCKKDETNIKTDPVITWTNPADINFGTLLSETQLNATADVPGIFDYTPSIGTKLNEGPNQDLKVDFTPTDATTYNTASKTVKINVIKADLKSGLWTGIYNNNLEISIILDDNMLIRADLVYKESDSDYNSVNLKNVEFGPFTPGSNSSFVIEETITIGDKSGVKEKLSVNLVFESTTEAKGQVTTTEDSILINTSDIELNWKSEIPKTGYIRDGSWSGGISSPILLSFSFSSVNGAMDGISFFWMDSRSMSFGTIGKSATISIGDDFNFTINQSIKVESHFTGYMEGNGNVILKLTSGNTSVPIDVNWYPKLPSKQQNTSSVNPEINQLINKYNKGECGNVSGSLKNINK